MKNSLRFILGFATLSALSMTSSAFAAPTVTGVAGCVLGNSQTVSQSVKESSTSSGGGGGSDGNRSESRSERRVDAVPCGSNSVSGTNTTVGTYYGTDSSGRWRESWGSQNAVNPYTYGSYVTATEINNAFYQLEREIIDTVIREHSTKINFEIADAVETATPGEDAGKFGGSTGSFSGVVDTNKSRKNVGSRSFDFTTVPSGF